MNQPSPEIIERVVGESDAGVRLDRFVAGQSEVGARSVAKRLVEEELVTVDDRVVARAAHALAAGQVVRFPRPIEEEIAVDESGPRPELRIVFEDPYLLVIDKQPDLIAHPTTSRRGPQPVTVSQLALEHCGALPTLAGDDRPGIVHRLDRDTTGIMLIPKTDEAFHYVRSQFKARTVKKQYRAICYGESRFDSDWIERNIAVHPRMGDRMTVVKEGGKEAATLYEVVERFHGFTDFRCRPRTGRTHQIRVHMTSVGHSLVGDRVYRSRNVVRTELPEGAPDPGRQCLHAERLQLCHPLSHEQISFEAPLPRDMVELLRWLRAARPPA